jgi:hypothetical protein
MSHLISNDGVEHFRFSNFIYLKVFEECLLTLLQKQQVKRIMNENERALVLGTTFCKGSYENID